MLVVAPAPTALEVGTSTGMFRITWVGPIDEALTVHFRLGGEAVSDQVPGAVGAGTWDYMFTEPESPAFTFGYDSETGIVTGTAEIAGQRTVALVLPPTTMLPTSGVRTAPRPWKRSNWPCCPIPRTPSMPT